MESANTREKALDAARELFSRKGYEAASLGDLATELGVKTPSLYKHFAGKEALYREVLSALETAHAESVAAVEAQLIQMTKDLTALGSLPDGRLWQETAAWLEKRHFTAAGRAYRRILAHAALEDPNEARKADDALRKPYLAAHEAAFSALIEAGVLRRGDPHVMAAEFLAPVHLWTAVWDADETRKQEALEELRRHVHQFQRVFAVRERQAQQQSRLFRR